MFIIKWDRIIWYEKIQLYEPLESGSWKHFDISTKNRKLMPIEIITVDYKYKILGSWSSESQSLSLFWEERMTLDNQRQNGGFLSDYL